MTTIIIEDEPLAAIELMKMLSHLDGSIKVLATMDSVAASLTWFKSNPMPDLIFADIYLSDGTCFDILRALKNHAPVVFCTGYDQHALEAFKNNGIDYLLKPITEEGIRKSILKVNGIRKNFISRMTRGSSLQKVLKELLPKYRSSLMVYEGDKIIAVELSEINFLVSDKNKCMAAGNDNTYDFDGTLDQLMPTLDPGIFFRANRQYIINRKAVKNIEVLPLRKLSVQVKGCNESVIVSREKKKAFIMWMEGLDIT